MVVGDFFHQQYDNESTNFQISTVIVVGFALTKPMSNHQPPVWLIGTWASKANNGKSFKAIIPRNEKKLPSQALKQPRPRRMIVLTSWHSCFLFGLFCVGGNAPKRNSEGFFDDEAYLQTPQKRKNDICIHTIYIGFITKTGSHSAFATWELFLGFSGTRSC